MPKSKLINLILFCSAITCLSFVLRTAYLLRNGTDILYQTPFSDEVSYYLPSAQAILDSGIQFFQSERSVWNGPLNPLWIAILNKKIPLIKIANIFIFSLATGVCATAILSSIGIGSSIFFALAIIFYPPTYYFIPTILTEPLFCSLLLLCLGSVLFNVNKTSNWTISGIFLGLATLARPTTQFLPAAFILLGIYYRFLRADNRYLALGLSSLIIISPVLINNFHNFDKIGLANGFGAVLYLGNDFRTDGDEPVYSGVDFDTQTYTAPYTHLDNIGDKNLTKEAIKRIRNHPIDFIKLTFRKVFRFIFGRATSYFFPHEDVVSFFANSSLNQFILPTWSAIQLCFTWIFGIAGIFIFSKTQNHLRTFTLIFVGYFVLLHSIAFPIPRLALPIYPFVLLSATYAIFRFNLKQQLILFTCFIFVSIYILFYSGRTFTHEMQENQFAYYYKKISGKIVAENDIISIQSSKVIKGQDPYVVVDFENVPLRRNQIVSYRISTKCPDDLDLIGTAQVFWRTTNQPAFSESCSAILPLRSRTKIVSAKPALNQCWQGNLTGLRLDLPASFQDCAVEIRDVQVLE